MVDAREGSGAEAGSSAPVFEVGARVSCQASFDQQYHLAEIIERRTNRDGSLSYYVHYNDFDKRLDEWAPVVRLAPPPPPSGAGSFLPVPLAGGAAVSSVPGAELSKLTRRQKRQYAETHHVPPPSSELPPLERRAEAAHAERTRVRNVQSIELGRYALDAWYYSPYPEPYGSCEVLHVCEHTFKYFRKRSSLLRHAARLERRAPPGDEVYRSPPLGPGATDPPLSVFEVDGAKNKVYCQNLCLLSKLFLDHKTLYYDVDPFFFYVLCERDAAGCHAVGYFSKEKRSPEGNNLACILTLPPWQRRGYGRFLIAFSYHLSKLEGRVGSPERPLSDLGAVSYRAYWVQEILAFLRDRRRSAASLQDIADATAIRPEDAVKTLESLGLVKYWKGDHIVSVTPRILEEHLRTLAGRRPLAIDPTRVRWVPYTEQGKKGTGVK